MALNNVGYAPLSTSVTVEYEPNAKPAPAPAPAAVLVAVGAPIAADPTRVHRGWKRAFFVLLALFLALASFVAHQHCAAMAGRREHRAWHGEHGALADHPGEWHSGGGWGGAEHHAHHEHHHGPGHDEVWGRPGHGREEQQQEEEVMEVAVEQEVEGTGTVTTEQVGVGGSARKLLKTLTRRQRERMTGNGHKPKAHSSYKGKMAKGFSPKGR